MSRRLLYDLEAPTEDRTALATTCIQCIVVNDLDTNEIIEFGPKDLKEGYELLEGASILAGHNIVEFDHWVLVKHAQRYLGREWEPQGLPVDTKYASRVIFPGSPETSLLRKRDFQFRGRAGQGALPYHLTGWHSLEAWGYRLQQEQKGKYEKDWNVWTREMQDYCRNDVVVNRRLYDYLVRQRFPIPVLILESLLGAYLYAQKAFGIGFDRTAAVRLMASLSEKRDQLEIDLRNVFPPELRPKGKVLSPKRSATSKKYEPGEFGYRNVQAGCDYQGIQLVEFNPGSSQHIVRRLVKKYGWQPTEFTPKSNEPQVTEEILRDLPYPESDLLADYAGAVKILGFISEGKQAYLRLEKDGRLHPRMNATGTVTNRCSHHEPNMGQCPSVEKPHGKEVRGMFTPGGGGVPNDWVMVGCDAAGLQLALYAHFVGIYDGGTFAKVYADGDPHEYMREASGLYIRANQKTLTYAKWFGAGYRKIGTIVRFDWEQALERGLTKRPLPPLSKAIALGRKVDASLRANMQGYAQLELALAGDQKKGIKGAASRGFVYGLDGRHLPVGQPRLALNVLLMGNEAVVMKVARVIAERRLAAEYTWLKDYAICLWVHDEFQVACRPDIAEKIGPILQSSIVDAGKLLGLRLTLKADWKVGSNWAETH